MPKGTRTEEQGIPKIQLLSRAADTSSGRMVYLGKCMTCHSEDGEGALNIPGNIDVPADSMKGYDYPPVYGEFSRRRRSSCTYRQCRYRDRHDDSGAEDDSLHGLHHQTNDEHR